MIRKLVKPVALLLIVTIAFPAALQAAPTASRTAAGQDDAARAVDLARARNLFGTDRIAAALSKEGLDPAAVDARLAVLTADDLIAMAANPAQLRSAGATMSRKMWTIVGIGAGALAVGAFALRQNDDGEDEDGSDDGED
jgi:membrane-bound lytic murein transglycosylase B